MYVSLPYPTPSALMPNPPPRSCGLGTTGFRVLDSGFRVQGSGFRVHGSGFGVQGSGYRVQGSGFRIQGAGCRVQGAGFRVQGSGRGDLGAFCVDDTDLPRGGGLCVRAMSVEHTPQHLTRVRVEGGGWRDEG